LSDFVRFFANFRQEHTTGNLKQTNAQPTTSRFIMLVLYLVKSGNDFYGTEYM